MNTYMLIWAVSIILWAIFLGSGMIMNKSWMKVLSALFGFISLIASILNIANK